MTKLTITQETVQNASDAQECLGANESDQVLHLKRVLVSLKQHYEKSLNLSQLELQQEQNLRIEIEKRLLVTQKQLSEIQNEHEAELEALRGQQIILKNLLKKAQDNPGKESHDIVDSDDQKEHYQQLELTIFSYKERLEKSIAENALLRNELKDAQNKSVLIQQEWAGAQAKSKEEMSRLQTLLSKQKSQDEHLETMVSQNSSHALRQEVEIIKNALVQGTQESRAIEERYVTILNDKISLEYQSKQLQVQVNEQAATLSQFQTQLLQLNEEKHKLLTDLTEKIEEIEKNRLIHLELNQIIEQYSARLFTFQEKEHALLELNKSNQALMSQLSEIEALKRDKDYLQDKYEQLKDEWKEINEQLEESLEIRKFLEERSSQQEELIQKQNTRIEEQEHRLICLEDEHQALLEEMEHTRHLLEENETNFKTAQQHLAKKVKEVTLHMETIDSQENNLHELMQIIDEQKQQLNQLYISLEIHQKEEKRLQDHLQTAIKTAEIQAEKWEEKYFKIYDKWQESENNVRELKRFEEKHHQMQSMLVNLGSFMGNPYGHSQALPAFASISESEQKPNDQQTQATPATEYTQEESFNLFGMSQNMEKQRLITPYEG